MRSWIIQCWLAWLVWCKRREAAGIQRDAELFTDMEWPKQAMLAWERYHHALHELEVLQARRWATRRLQGRGEG